MARPHGRARVDRHNPQSFGECDSCGMLYKLVDLSYQFEWYGTRIQQTNMLKCWHCLDRLQEQHRTFHLPADPVPIEHPRIERESFITDPISPVAITYGIGPQPTYGTITQGGGLRSAFDGNPAKPFFLCAAQFNSNAGDNIIGRSWFDITDNNQGVSVSRFVAYAPVDGKFFAGGPCAWRFDGAMAGAPLVTESGAPLVDGQGNQIYTDPTFTTLASGTTQGIFAEVLDVSFIPTTNYMYHQFVLTGDGVGSVAVSLLRIFRNANTEPMVPSPPPATGLQPPPFGFVYLLGPDGDYLLGPDGQYLIAPA